MLEQDTSLTKRTLIVSRKPNYIWLMRADFDDPQSPSEDEAINLEDLDLPATFYYLLAKLEKYRKAGWTIQFEGFMK